MRSPWRLVGHSCLSLLIFYSDTILITNVRLSKTRATRTELKFPHRSLESGLVRLVRGGSALSKHSVISGYANPVILQIVEVEVLLGQLLGNQNYLTGVH